LHVSTLVVTLVIWLQMPTVLVSVYEDLVRSGECQHP